MDGQIALFLLQDGVVNGAVYALLALSLVLVFAVTRVILVPQGEFVAYGALTYAALDQGQRPGSLWLLATLGGTAFVFGLWRMRRHLARNAVARLAVETLVVPGLVVALVAWAAPRHFGPIASALMAILVVTPMAGFLYRIAFEPLAEASVLVLLIAAIGVHLALTGLGLVFFGAEGYRASAFAEGTLTLDILTISGQALAILVATGLLIVALFAFFEWSLIGKALRATAVNRLGARLVGIPTALSGRIAFLLAGFIGALSGVLIVPLTTIYYDSGFLIALKGFAAAIIGGMISYPVAALAAILVGIVESAASFYASAYKEVIVFLLIVPVLLWRSLSHAPTEES